MEVTDEFKCLTLDNSTGELSLKQHIFKHSERKTKWTREIYNGNISLCGKVFASSDGETADSFASLENEPFNDDNCCKLCLRILTLSEPPKDLNETKH